jgi:hypothetical protein
VGNDDSPRFPYNRPWRRKALPGAKRKEDLRREVAIRSSHAEGRPRELLRIVSLVRLRKDEPAAGDDCAEEQCDV